MTRKFITLAIVLAIAIAIVTGISIKILPSIIAAILAIILGIVLLVSAFRHRCETRDIDHALDYLQREIYSEEFFDEK